MGIKLKTEIPGPKSRALYEERKKHVARGPFHATTVFLESAKGALLTDVDGNQFIDFAAGIGVTNLGHAPADLVNAVQTQAAKVLHAGFNVTPYECYVRLAEKLNRLTPGTHHKKTLLVNSGAEAVENAIKFARTYTNRPGIVCFEHAFHGRTYMAMTLTAKEKPYKAGFGPFCSDVYRTAFPDFYRLGENAVEECFQQFENLVRTQGASQIAAVILEPVLGEGGFVPTPVKFLEKLQKFCKENGILTIADEIQTGFGRTGTLFASEQLGWVPDLMTMAKGLGGGLPIAAVTGRAEIMDAPIEGGVGGTYGGNPVACASALAVIEQFEDNKKEVFVRARGLAEALRSRLLRWEGQFPFIGNVRGLGPMQAMEFVKDRNSKEPYKEGAAQLQQYAFKNGVVLLTCGSHGHVARFLMPLTIEPELLTQGLNVLEEGLKTIK